MLLFLYELVLWLAAVLVLPKMIYQRLFFKKYRRSLWQRFGRGFSQISRDSKPLIWLHAVSVGETKAAATFIKQLKQKLDATLIVSSVTETGHAEAKRSIIGADHYVYLPFDAYGMITPIVTRLRPDYVIISETDNWLNFLRAAKKVGAFTVVINGKISARSARRLKKIPFFASKLFGYIDLFCLQHAIYQERFLQLSVAQEKIKITGNLKFDAAPVSMTEREMNDFKHKLGLLPQNQVLVIGSTHDPEEKEFIRIFKQLHIQMPSLRLIIVPRHPERFDIVARLLDSFHLPFLRFSCGQPLNGLAASVILIDQMGLLNKCYQIASIAIVAGSYTPKVGGHNILEPLWFHTPLIFGPHMEAQPELLSIVKHYQAGLQMSFDELSVHLPTLLNDQNARLKLIKAGQKLISEMQGATRRTLDFCMPYVD